MDSSVSFFTEKVIVASFSSLSKFRISMETSGNEEVTVNPNRSSGVVSLVGFGSVRKNIPAAMQAVTATKTIHNVGFL